MYNTAAEVAQHFGRLVPRLIKLYPLTTTGSLLQSLVPCSPEEPSDRAFPTKEIVHLNSFSLQRSHLFWMLEGSLVLIFSCLKTWGIYKEKNAVLIYQLAK